MSNTANWSYTNTAKVKTRISVDQWSGETVYSEPYEINCTWSAKAQEERDDNGQEFVSKNEIFTEDERPKHLDLILLNGQDEATDWQEIRSVTSWDMSFFGEVPDYKLVT